MNTRLPATVVTAKPDCGCDQAMDWNPPHPNWAEIFFGNPLEGISNDQTEEQAGAELGQAQCLA